MKKLIAVLGLTAFFFFAAAPNPAVAASTKLWPSQFTPISWSVSTAENESYTRQNFHWLGATDAGWASFESEVQLPVGASVTRFSVNASSVSGQPAVEAVLLRAKLGGEYEIVAEFELAGGNDRGWYSASTIAVPKVAPGYKYWVHLDIAGTDTYIYGAQVSYK